MSNPPQSFLFVLTTFGHTACQRGVYCRKEQLLPCRRPSTSVCTSRQVTLSLRRIVADENEQKGTKVPGGFLLPVSVVKKADKPKAVEPDGPPICLIQ